MPANLNALIRYKAIDRRLSNRFSPCTIGQLQEICSEALGEFRGVYKKVSERTIRDDIRVMRSEMLGFNAPIVCKDGLYSYSDPNYSVFSVSIRDLDLLKQVTMILLENRSRLSTGLVDDVIRDLRNIIEQEERVKHLSKHYMESGSEKYAPDEAEVLAINIFEDIEPLKEPATSGWLNKRFRKIWRSRKKVVKESMPLQQKLIDYKPDSVQFQMNLQQHILTWGMIFKVVKRP